MKKPHLVGMAVLLFFSGIFTAASGQKELLPQYRPADARFDNLEIENGKAGITVYSLFQDSRDFIWCSADAGLYRYDGSRFLKFSFGNNDTCLYGYLANIIYEDRKGQIWVGTHGGLSRINNDKRTIDHFIPDTTDLKSRDNSVRLIREDSEGKIWIMTDRDVFRLDTTDSSFSHFHVDSLPLRSLEALIVDEKDKFAEDSKGFIWFATDKGLFRYRKKNQQWDKVFPSDFEITGNLNPKINCIKTDSEGNLWIGTESCGLLRITDPEKGSYETIRKTFRNPADLSPEPIISMLVLHDNDIWFTEGIKLCKLRAKTNELSEYIISDRLSPEIKWNSFVRMNKIIRGFGDEIWLFNYASGILFNFKTLTEIVSQYLVPRYIVFDVLFDTTGNLWFGCVANDIFILVTNGLPYRSGYFQHNGGLDNSFMNYLAEDNHGDILISSWPGIYKLRDPLKTDVLSAEKTDFKAGKNIPAGLFRDSQNNLWICYSGGLINKHRPDGRLIKSFKLPGGPYGTEQGAVRIIREDKQGNLWFATNDARIFKLGKGEDSVRMEFTSDQISARDKFQLIMDFNIDRENNIWISSYVALYRINQLTGKIEDLTGFEGSGRIFGNIYYRIINDKKEKLWILCSVGSPHYYDFDRKTFVCPYPKELMPDLSFTDMRFDNAGRIWLVDNNIITVFDTLSRVRYNYPLRMNGNAPRSFVTTSGRVLFMIGTRILLFPPERAYNKSIPPVNITGIFVNNEDYTVRINRWKTSIPDEAVLSYRENNIKIEFAALNYVTPSMNRYRFIMEGVDRDTSFSDGNPVAEYRNMAPGKYKFWVTGSNNDGVWNPYGTNLFIKISPPWYKSSLAISAYILLFFTLIFFYIRLRIRNLYKEKTLLEKEVRLRTEELEIKNRKLSEIDRIKTDFFTDISHEIRTPLTLILGPLDLLMKSFEQGSKVYSSLVSVRRNANRLLHLVNELLDISRLDSGKMKITLIEEDIVRNLRMLVYEFLSLAESRKINYIAEVPQSVVITLYDRDKTNRIITNLLTNAFRYTPENGTVKCITSIEKSKADDNLFLLKIIVSDTGTGISEKHIGEIFNRFYRIEGHFENNEHGSGIGLSVVKEFITLLHGNIDVRSREGEGSSFTVELPLGTEHLEKAEYIIAKPGIYKSDILNDYQDEIESEKNYHSDRSYRGTILVIEDNKELRTYIAENLSGRFHIVEAGNGKTGVSFAMSMLPDLIISDIIMPDLNGLDLCIKLKYEELTSHIPIILLTAKATPEDKLTGLRSGADDYIVKPFSMDELEARITNLLEIREKLRLKYLSPGNTVLKDAKSRSVDDLFMEKVFTIINDNLRSFDFDVNYLHNLLGISRMHLTRKIKALTGLSPHILIRNIRLEKAAGLLRARVGNITEVANSVGISNPAHFTKSFSEYFGTSPRTYLKQFKT